MRHPRFSKAFILASLSFLLLLASPCAFSQLPLTVDHPNLPRGYELTAYHDCGTDTQTQAGDGPALAQRTGEAYAFPGVKGPVGTAAYAPEQVEFEATGLDPRGHYVLGFTWWDADSAGRRQSVHFAPGEEGDWQNVLPAATPAAAFHKGESTYARILLPLLPEHTAEGRCRVAFRKEAGPNAVISELWLLRRATDTPRKRVLIVTGDDYPGHRWRETGPELAAALRDDLRLEVSITESPAIYASPLLDYYDATLLHFKDYAERMPVDAAVWKGLERYVSSGKGLVIAHFGCGAFQEWEGFVNTAGRVWNPAFRGHDPYGPFDIRITQQQHPITQGMKGFSTEDELYTCLDGKTPITVLCEATSKVDEKDYPMGFVLADETKRVFHCPLGHDANALQQPGARELFRRATAWAAGAHNRSE